MVARDAAAGQQPGAGGGRVDDSARHPVPAGARCPDRGQAVGGSAVLRCLVPAADGTADGGARHRCGGALEGHPRQVAGEHDDAGTDRERSAGASGRVHRRRLRLADPYRFCPGSLGSAQRVARHFRQDPPQGPGQRRAWPDAQLLGHAAGALGACGVRPWRGAVEQQQCRA
ncbi:hypothetical protein D3C79_840470 [compost metagenome]